MKLHYRRYGEPNTAASPLLFLHGLFGSGSNWHSMATALQDDHEILVADLRNHGRSPHANAMSYEAMVSDVVALLERLSEPRVTLVGHSMGGKVAMLLALRHPALVERLMVVDMAPVAYPSRFDGVLRALNGLPLQEIQRRGDADILLARDIPEDGVRGFLLQNLIRNQQGEFAWRMNLAAISDRITDLMGFPAVDTQFLGPTQFLYGGQSDYMQAQYEPIIRQLFPYATSRAIAGAGHWLYAEKPAAFLHALQHFLGS